ncbi:MAG: endonuclease IV [Clostridia bacterium]|nr:endonuclease IV [Clostridia bacterium]
MIRFGPSGNGDLFYDQGFKTSLDAPTWLKNRGLNLYEYSFSRGFGVSELIAKTLGEKCRENDIEISVHAPYYINLANPDPKMIEKSFNYIITSLKFLKIMGGKKCVFHPGTCGGMNRVEAFDLLKKNMQELVKRIDRENFDFEFYLCPETLGKSQQLGTYEEVGEICTYADYLVPTLDFGHINALTQGKLKKTEDYDEIFTFLIDKIGLGKVKNIHIHFSKIEFGDKGEIRHLTFEDKIYGPEFEPLAKVIKKYKLEPTVICESKGTQAEDSSKMKKIYEDLKEEN